MHPSRRAAGARAQQQAHSAPARCCPSPRPAPPARPQVMLTNGTNTAKGKSALSTTFTTGKGPAKAVDGDKATSFQGALPANTDAGYWKLDLGAAGVSGAPHAGPHAQQGPPAQAAAEAPRPGPGPAPPPEPRR